ncbi:MAG: Calx-beta domain-containing protein [Candidatus Margulisbacteria bacterium]|nr:Calx-beta domain-containing protein [Candidatus Margulisiibacteriota bacterium]
MKKKIIKWLVGGLLFSLLPFALPAFAGDPHTSYGIITSGDTNCKYSFYVISRPSEKLSGSLINVGGSYLWSVNVGSLPTAWNNLDDSLAFITKEANSGTTSHQGYYAVMNETISSVTNPQPYATATLRALPTPTATANAVTGAVDISWTAIALNPDTSDTPNSGNVTGYNVYRSTNGISFTRANTSIITNTGSGTISYSDTGGVDGTTYYYAIEPVFTVSVNSGILSANSNTAVDPTAPVTPTVAFSSASSSGSESTTSVTIPVVLSAAAASTVTVNYSVTGGTATGSGTDYTLASGTLTFAAGDTSESISVTVVNDSLDEANETIIIGLSSPSGATLGSITSHTYTITDNDATPTVGFTSAAQSSAAESGTMTITASLSAVSGRAVSVPYTMSGTATNGTDYSITTSPITIAAGSTTGTITITITSDTAVEGNETVIVAMGTPTNATASGTTTHTATITDDDVAAPTISYVTWEGTVSPSSDAGYVYGTINIIGTNFGATQGASSVALQFYGGSYTSVPAANIYYWSDTLIQVGVPKSIGTTYAVAGTTNVRVTVSGNTDTDSFTIKPRVYSVDPVSGPVGTKVTIVGAGLHGTAASNSVSFNGTSSNAATVARGTSVDTIEVYVPSGATTGQLLVTVNSQTSNTNYSWSPYAQITFTVTSSDTTPPTISSTSPINGTTGVSTTEYVTINFSEAMSTDGFSISSYPSAGTWTYSWTDSDTVRCSHSTRFSYSTTYTVTVAATAKDLAGNLISGDRDIYFRTTSAPGTANLDVTPTYLLYTATAEGDNPLSQTFTISNTGSATMTWAASKSVSWLTLSRSGGSLLAGASTVETVSASIAGLSAGNYADLITVSSSGGTEEVAVALVISAAPEPAPAISRVYNKAASSETYVYVTPYDPSWEGEVDYSLNLGVEGTDFGEKALYGSSEAPAASYVAIKPYGFTNYVTLSDDPASPPVRMYWWSDTAIEIGVPDELDSTKVVAGAATLKVITAGGEDTESFTIRPRIYGITSTAAIGEKVVVTGTAFGTNPNVIEVSFGGTTVTPTLADNTSLEVVVPAGLETGASLVFSVYVNEVESNSMTFEVAAAPDQPALSVSPTSLSFTSYVGGTTTNPTSNTITISNSQAGTGSFEYAASSEAAWLTVTPTSGSVSDPAPVTLTASINLANAPTDVGTYEAAIVITSAAAQGSPKEVSVTLQVKAISGPTIASLSSNLGPAGTRVTLNGLEFGLTQGASQVKFSKDGAATDARIVSWSDTSIEVIVPFSLTEGIYNVEIFKFSIAAEGINVLSQSDAAAFQVTAAASAGIATIYPTPFNPRNGETITIQFNPGTVTNIGVYIYDATARVMLHRTVTGVTQTTWDGTDASGAIVGDGVYLVMIINEDSKALIAKGKALVVKR